MHCSLRFGSIGARAKWIGVASHHHTAAIVPRDIRRSASGVRSEIVPSSTQGSSINRNATLTHNNKKAASAGRVLDL